MFSTSLVYNLRVGLGLIQVALIILLTRDGLTLDLLRYFLSKYKEWASGTPKVSDEIQYNLMITRINFSVVILLIANQSIKMLNLAFGLHKSHHRQIQISGVLDLLNVVFYVAMLVIYHLPNMSYYFAYPELEDSRCAFGIVLSIASCALTFLLVSKLRQLDSLPSPNISLLYRLRVVLGLFQVASIVILTLTGGFTEWFRWLENMHQDDNYKDFVPLWHKSYLVSTALVAIQCFRKIILAVGLHKNNPFVISASGVMDIIVVALFGWIFCLCNNLNKLGLLRESEASFTERMLGFGIGISVSSAILCFILSFKLRRQSSNAVA